MRRRPNALIRRANWHDTRAYLRYCREVRQVTAGTIEAYRGALDLLLRWARDWPLHQLDRLRPTFPAWLALEDRAISYQRKTCATVRNFLRWAADRWPRYARLPTDAVDAIRPARGLAEPQHRAVYSLAEVRSLCAVPVASLADARTRAAIAMLFLSGMRVGAFCTLPIRAVDLESWSVRQWPSLGVATKNRHAATTYLLGIEDLRGIVRDWDTRVRSELPPGALWYAPLDPSGRLAEPGQPPGRHRSTGLNRRLRALCERAGIAYRSAHKLRHGHAVYALSQISTMAEFKAVSQNLMHASLQITDQTYSGLVEDDVARVIRSIGDAARQPSDHVLDLVRELLARLDEP